MNAIYAAVRLLQLEAIIFILKMVIVYLLQLNIRPICDFGALTYCLSHATIFDNYCISYEFGK